MRPQGKDGFYKSKRLSSHCNILYPPFGRIDFISVSPLRLECLEISLHWHAENTSSITKNINLCFLPRGVCSKAHKFKHMKTWLLGIYVLPSSFPSHYPLPHRLPTKWTLPITLPWKATATQTLFVSDCFLSLCAHVRTLLDLVCLWLCVLVYSVLIVAGTWGNEHGSVWRRRNRRQYTNNENGQKNERDTKWVSYQSETGGEIYLSSPNPLSFLMIVFNVPPPLLNSKWSMYQILSPCQSLSLSSVLVWVGATLEGDMFCFQLLSLCFLMLCCLRVSFVPYRAITLDNQLVVLATTAADAGRYHVEAVNEMTGENVTSPAIYLSISGKKK